MGLQEAGHAPRIQHVDSSEPTGTRMADGGTAYSETGFPPETERALLTMGHNAGRTDASTFGGYQAIRVGRTNKVCFGASESRKDGPAAGC